MRLKKLAWSLLLCLSTTAIQANLDVYVSAQSAILINAETGKVLFEKDSHEPRYPASTTKIATVWYSLERIPQNQYESVVTAPGYALGAVSSAKKSQSGYKLPPYWIETGSTHIGLKPGEQMMFKDLIYGAMIASGNDACNVLAHHVSGSIEQFTLELNDFLKQKGCLETNFYNPHGLHHPEHMTTAYDLSMMTYQALKNPIFAQVCKTVNYWRPQTNLQKPTLWTQTNGLLKKGKYFYPKAMGVKTGLTNAAKNTLVSAAKDDNRYLIAVVLGCEQRVDAYKDVVAMFEAAFNEPKIRTVIMPMGLMPQNKKVTGGNRVLQAYCKQEVSYDYYHSEPIQVRAFIVWDDLQLPIYKDQKIGEIKLIETTGRMYAKYPIFANNAVELTPGAKLMRLWNNSSQSFKAIITIISLGLVILLALGATSVLKGRR